MWTSKTVRDEFVGYFIKRAHDDWRSSGVVPIDDPTLLFVNAGMCQFKKLFLGQIMDGKMGQLVRAANSQKCIRAGGKHNDLDDVGKDVYHHTFFEMLGNWSFGDYYKKEAIDFAWDLLTNVYQLEKDRLYVTYFEGDESLGLEADLETLELWKEKVGDHARIIPGNTKDNFWEMGDTGPCGPCTEIHYDKIGNRMCADLVNKDDPDVLEIWNLVFMQFNRDDDGNLKGLPRKCVDTGMGLERLVSILAKVSSNYDTDLFTIIMTAINTLICPDLIYRGLVGIENDPNRVDLAYRVLSDHIRTVSISIADGVIPSNEGRGYVIRRILRRAVHYGNQYLGATVDSPWFYMLIDSVIESLGDVYSELGSNRDKIIDLVVSEEKLFMKTLQKGTRLFRKAIELAKSKTNLGENPTLSGKTAFELYTVYGFPIDLTKLLCEENNVYVDEAAFLVALEDHQLISSGRGGGSKQNIPQLNLAPEFIEYLHQSVCATDDSAKYDWSSKWETGCVLETAMLDIFTGEEFIEEATEGSLVSVITKATNFYAESGGQVGDIGCIRDTATDKLLFSVFDCRKIGRYVLHYGRCEKYFRKGHSIKLSPDYGRRHGIAKNHTATHLLNFALRKLNGDSVQQAGSIVEEGRLRFDYTSSKPMSVSDCKVLEKEVSEIVRQGLPVVAKLVNLSEAMKNSCIRKMVGVNYPDPVRVVQVGGEDCSMEFCGGTHIENSSEIGDFVVVSDEAISRGVRRVIAITGIQAEGERKRSRELLTRAAEVSENSVMDLAAKIDKLLNLKSDSLIAKAEFDTITDKLKKLKIESDKNRSKHLRNRANSMVENLKEVDELFTCLILDELEGDFKAMEIVLNSLVVKNPVMIISGTSILAGVSKTFSLGANEWVSGCIEGLKNAKSGGSKTVARGQLPPSVDIEKIRTNAVNIIIKHFS